MPRSLTDPLTLATALAAVGLLASAVLAIVRQARAPRVTADSLIVPPRRLYSTFDPLLRDETARKRRRVEELQARARRASAGLPVAGDVVPMRQRRSS